MRPSGVIAPIPSPMAGRGEKVDVDALERYAGFLIDGGVDGIFPCGSIGEFSSLTTSQRYQIFKSVTNLAADVPVFAGCSDTSIADVLMNLDAAKDAGVDAAVVASPYYLATEQRGLLRFFNAIADESPLPLLLYNIPSLTGIPMDVGTVSALSNRDQIIGIKDTTYDIVYHSEIIDSTDTTFSVLQGSTALSVASLDVGADGIVAGPANVFPSAIKELYDSYQQQERDRTLQILNEVVNPVVSAMSDIPTAAAIKYLVSLSGMDIGQPLPPLAELDSEQQETLHQCYQTVHDSIANLQC